LEEEMAMRQQQKVVQQEALREEYEKQIRDGREFFIKNVKVIGNTRGYSSSKPI
jgi:uncharacterized protein YnzC (UPF0291/DUF896 family)